MEIKVKVSVIIPIYNAEKYLHECLDSVLRQTLCELEVICVDDGSTDDSLRILMEYAKKDVRVKIITHEKSLSAAKCRKDGVLASSGDYIVFSDSDDFFETNALELSYKAIIAKKVDILHFGSFVENCADLPQSRIDMNDRLVAPYLKNDVSDNLLEECFINKKFGFNVWGKIFSGPLCRKAMSFISDGYFPKANDLYAAYIIYDLATSYSAIDTKLYHYCFGRGQTGSNLLTKESFELCCKSTYVYNELESYSKKQEKFSHYEKILERIKQNLMAEQVNKWYTLLDTPYKVQGYDFMIKNWGSNYSSCISKIAERFWFNRKNLANFINGSMEMTFARRKIRTIALYYRNIVNGGAQRVVTGLCNMLAKKYTVILVTDEEPSPEDYTILPNIQRFIIPHRLKNAKNYYNNRAAALVNLIEKYEIDLFINSMWVEPCTFFDKLVIKSHPTHPAYITHCHNFFGMLFRNENDTSLHLWKSFALDDALILLSSVDVEYWQTTNPSCYFIRNQNTFTKDTAKKNTRQGKYILWLNRISYEKRPLEALKIMELVKKKHPDAVLHIVGTGEKSLEKKLQEEIECRNLAQNVVIEGYSNDVSQFYKKADLLLYTSEYEGWPLVLFEAAAFGIPTVLYDLSFLEYYKVISGYESVPQMDSTGAARKICNLLQDENLWEEKSRDIFESYLRLEDDSVFARWENVIHNLEAGLLPQAKHSPYDEKIMIQKILDFGAERTKRIESLKKQLDSNAKYLAEVKSSTAWKVGRLITWFPRKAKSFIKKTKQKRNTKGR